jgi:hypothetical protein
VAADIEATEAFQEDGSAKLRGGFQTSPAAALRNLGNPARMKTDLSLASGVGRIQRIPPRASDNLGIAGLIRRAPIHRRG